jgi:hypothetical protein
MTKANPGQSGDCDAQPSTMNSQLALFLVQIKEIVDFEEELAES